MMTQSKHSQQPGPDKTDPQSAPRQKNWSGKSIARQWQYEFFYLLIRIGKQALPLFFLHFLVGYYILFRPLVRRRVQHYLRRRFPGAGFFSRLRHSYLHCLTFGKVLIARSASTILGSRHFAVTLQGKQQLQDILNNDTGCIVLTAHVGCWQSGLFSLDFIDAPVSLVLEQPLYDTAQHQFTHIAEKQAADTRGQQQRNTFEYIDPSGPFGGSLVIQQRLHAGGVVSIMGDRVAGSTRSLVTLPFLGEPAVFPLSPYYLASTCGVPLVVLLSWRVDAWSFVLDLAEVITVPAGLGRKNTAYVPYVKQFVQCLEQYTAQHPYQFFNFHDMWQTPERDKHGNKTAH